MFGFFKKKLKEMAEKAKNIFGKKEEEEENVVIEVPEELQEFDKPEMTLEEKPAEEPKKSQTDSSEIVKSTEAREEAKHAQHDLSESSEVEMEEKGEKPIKEPIKEEKPGVVEAEKPSQETQESVGIQEAAEKPKAESGEESTSMKDKTGDALPKEESVSPETEKVPEEKTKSLTEEELSRKIVEENVEEVIETQPEKLRPPMEMKEESEALISEPEDRPEAKPEIMEKAVEELEKEELDSQIAQKETAIEAETEIEAFEKEAEDKGDLRAFQEIEERVEEVEKRKKEGFFKSIIKGLTKKVIKEEHLENIIYELKLALIEGDVALDVAEKICEEVKAELVGKEVGKGEDVERLFVNALKKAMLNILDVPHERLVDEIRKAEKPYLILFIGFNGVGKTTTLAKLAKYLMDNGFSVVMAAGDTFRAASIEQLEEHGSKLGIHVVKSDYGRDSAAVIYDAMEYARKNGIDVVLADTAGRSHDNKNLMDELKKIIRVTKPNKKILVIDSITGNDAVIQAESFAEVGIDGIIMTKMDVNEKGGSALSVVYTTGKPILFITTGQDYGDIEEFSPETMVQRLFD